ncbi:glycosyltransferase family 2 protein [Salinimicrobium tongyeongense]|uniref:Glycosyltransferase family 2 protein n=1 Tax=Salinimicrobium tongyeongense TaxID=2809707 RepID=A0ABY6NT27_9FLAO|nr:glycosyltransferase family A protein [Salinimicrobium tongyeongense]UZH55633.1 glycosyltransferase family 2 protein [Salinimicrobium tongyeongense]
MRSGTNPQKAKEKIRLENKLRVIMVVFIPNTVGFYANSLEVFKLSLRSLIGSNSDQYKITVVNNGSCQEVQDFLASFSGEEIDTIIYHSKNIGKIDALIGAARGARESLITLTDADILFLKNWFPATQEVFHSFKKAGSVSPIPFRHGFYYGTSSVLKDILLKKLKFQKLKIPENFADHNKYLESINWGNEKTDSLDWPVVQKANVRAIVGSGHQVLTIKREILFSTVPISPSLTLIGEDSEFKYIDEPIDRAGLLRLATFRNHAFHMEIHWNPGWRKNSMQPEQKNPKVVPQISKKKLLKIN